MAPPADLRYIRGVRKYDQTGESRRAHVVTFLEQVYQSQAETLPDVRDDTDVSDVLITSHTFKCGLEEHFADPYADLEVKEAKAPKLRKFRKHCRSVRINPARLDEEQRFLPPGTMYDVFQQMRASHPQCTASFPQFWRIWRQEYPHMKFRAQSSHALCSVCVKHKMLIKDFGHHLKARAAQQQYYLDHLDAQFRDRCIYWRARASSRLRSSSEIVIIMDSMDQAKFGCPRSNVYRSKELNTLQRPRLHITLAIVHGYFLAISVSSPNLPKDSTTMCELLAHCLTLLQRQGVVLSKVSLTVQADNTPREYKNNPFLRFLAFLTSNQIVASASLKTLRTGHSHEDVDQVFGLLAKHLVHRVRSLATPSDFVRHIHDWMINRLKRDYEKERYCFLLDQCRILGI